MIIEIFAEDILIGIIKYINKEISSMPLGSFIGIISIFESIIKSKSITKKNFVLIVGTALEMTCSMVDNLYIEYEKLNLNTNLEDYLKLNEMFGNSFEFFFQGNFKSFKTFQIKDNKLDNFIIIYVHSRSQIISKY